MSDWQLTLLPSSSLTTEDDEVQQRPRRQPQSHEQNVNINNENSNKKEKKEEESDIQPSSSSNTNKQTIDNELGKKNNRNPNDYQWLRNVMNASSKAKESGSMVERLVRYMDSKDCDYRMNELLKEVQYLVEDVDEAIGMAKTPNAIETFKQLITYKRLSEDKHERESSVNIRGNALWVMSTIAQNNKYCQQALHNHGVFDYVWELMQSESNPFVISKMMGVTSAMVGNFPPIQKLLFEKKEETLNVFASLFQSFQNEEVVRRKLEIVLWHLQNVEATTVMMDDFDHVHNMISSLYQNVLLPSNQ